MKVTLDTNVIVSSFLSPIGAPVRIVEAWRDEAFDLVVSLALIAEYVRALNYPKIRDRAGLTEEAIRDFGARVQRFAIVVEPTDHLSVVEADPDDNLVLECAQAGNVDVIVSGDRYLLALGTFGSIVIVSPTEFARLLQR